MTFEISSVFNFKYIKYADLKLASPAKFEKAMKCCIECCSQWPIKDWLVLLYNSWANYTQNIPLCALECSVWVHSLQTWLLSPIVLCCKLNQSWPQLCMEHTRYNVWPIVPGTPDQKTRAPLGSFAASKVKFQVGQIDRFSTRFYQLFNQCKPFSFCLT